jgi:hypothetical protein
MTHALPCIACGKQLPNVFDDAENQPENGLAFITHGHYGSGAFDPMDGEYIEITVCDDCVRRAASEGKVLAGRDTKPVICEGVLVGHERVNRATVPFNPDVAGSFDATDVLNVDPEDVWADHITWTHEGRLRIEWRVPKPNNEGAT